jgi:hypothetical protein
LSAQARTLFSATSGTNFACRKPYFVDLPVCERGKGASALQLSRDLDVQYNAAFVLAHKLRKALAAETADLRLSNTVEVVGAYFGSRWPSLAVHCRPAFTISGGDLVCRQPGRYRLHLNKGSSREPSC